MSVRTDIARMYFEEEKNLEDITQAIKKDRPELNEAQRRNYAWSVIRHDPRRVSKRKEGKRKLLEIYKGDGSIISERFVELIDCDEATPERILAAHGKNPNEWEIVNHIANYWNSQLKDGIKQISFQSKLVAKPKKKKCVDFAHMEELFNSLERKPFTPAPYKKQGEATCMAEVNIADLHLGKMCWNGETQDCYDLKIAQDIYYKIIHEAIEEIKGKPIEYITFVWANDFFNSDTIEQTTTGGTRQDTDSRWQKMFDVGCEMLVRGIELLAEVAPVKTFYTPSNHDEVNGYHANKFIAAWFRLDHRVEVDTSAKPRKYLLYGNTLIGFTHGYKENTRGNAEKASLLASCMPIEVPALWGQAKTREFHAAHLHGEQMIAEINGVIVRRMSSPTAADAWHTKSGYIGSVRKAQCFLYDKQKGLKHTINIPV